MPVIQFCGIIPSEDKDKGLEKTLDARDQATLLAAEGTPEWFKRMLEVALKTSLSRVDLLRLTWAEVDWKNGLIIPRGGRQKTKVRQFAPMVQRVREILEAIKREQERSRIASLAGLVFVDDEGQPISRRRVEYNVVRLRNRTGIRHWSFHTTRHAAISAWAVAGIPADMGMVAAGHKSAAMYNHYLDLMKPQDVADQFGTRVVCRRCIATKKGKGDK